MSDQDDLALPLRGGCMCGEVEYAVRSPFVYALNCHCGRCRRTTGSAFKPMAGVDEVLDLKGRHVVLPGLRRDEVDGLECLVRLLGEDERDVGEVTLVVVEHVGAHARHQRAGADRQCGDQDQSARDKERDGARAQGAGHGVKK